MGAQVVVNDDAPVAVSPVQAASDSLQRWGLSTPGSTLYLEAVEEEGGSSRGESRALVALEAMWYNSDIRFVEKGSPTCSGGVQVAVDTREQVAMLKDLLSRKLAESSGVNLAAAELRLFLPGTACC